MNKKNEQTTLTQVGEARRQKILSELKLEMNRSLEKRSQRNTLIAFGISACLIGSIVWVSNWNADPENQVVDNELVQANTAADNEIEVPHPIEYGQLTFETMTDEELLEAMARMGKPSVLGEIGGEVTLVFQGNL